MKTVSIIIFAGKSILADSISNENSGVILLKEGAKLKIYGEGCFNGCYSNGKLYIIPNNLMAIYGSDYTSFYMYRGTIKILSTSDKIGGLYLTKNIIFYNGTFIYEAMSGTKDAIKAKNMIILKGEYILNLELGVGI